MRCFWQSPQTAEWFKERNYTLYKALELDGEPIDIYAPQIPSEDFVEAVYPYPYHDKFSGSFGPEYNRAFIAAEAVGVAQDSAGHHVAIKHVLVDSDELRIYEFLRKQSLEVMEENCILPILDILYSKRICFAVMPRWGENVEYPHPSTLQEVMFLMRSMLKVSIGFSELKTDMSFPNCLVNHFSWSGRANPKRAKLRREGRLSYAVFDFDISVMVPEGVDSSKFRLPYKMSFYGNMFRPYDTAQGEPDYDPFAFDVGNLGQLWCSFYQHHSVDLPILAPLLDMMTTRKIKWRFTAQQALDFLEEQLVHMSQAALQVPYSVSPDWTAPYDEYDRWAHVPDGLARRWAAFREPKLPWRVKLLRWIYSLRFVGPWIPALGRELARITFGTGHYVYVP
ncbi:hypothetical protein FA15DRAFT_598045 [Coprinopsis marcescibilis]|uniref:Protein kinase domain-containing protein n=1 Tax=Coprinopsis marcescibilis TaxID=230819 RepID=A0A5C3KLT5_COPMA|nr:hypothetical protein FA15DRAFT_598045 [Coprinopsis marcescibilis]